MDMIDIARQLLLYSHILVFALAMADVLREDWRMLRASRLDMNGLEEAAQRIKWLLILLWATGIPLVGLSLGWDFSALADKPKLMTKIIVTSALTLNGVLLHFWVFPMLQGKGRRPGLSAAAASVFGSISTVSWLYAAFVGAARLIAPQMTLDIFLGIYVVALLGGMSVAVLFMRQRVERMIAASANDPVGIPAGNEVAAFKAIELAMTAVVQAQNRLVAARDSVLSAAGAAEPHSGQELALSDRIPLELNTAALRPVGTTGDRLPGTALAG
jgi:hypothetical protein